MQPLPFDESQPLFDDAIAGLKELMNAFRKKNGCLVYTKHYYRLPRKIKKTKAHRFIDSASRGYKKIMVESLNPSRCR